MNGKKQLFALAVLLCSISQPLFAISEVELIKMIDQRRYKEVTQLFPNEISGSESHAVFKAYAELGLAGFEPLELIQRIRAPQVFSNNTLNEYFKKCPNIPLDKKLNTTPKCVVLRFFNQIPQHTNQMLLAARKSFQAISTNGALSRQDRLLYAITELSMIMSKLRESLFLYHKLDENNVSYEEASKIYESIRSAGEDMDLFVKHYKDIDIIFNHQLFGSKSGFLLEVNAEGKVEFLQKTGLPLFFKVTDMSEESTKEIAGRNILVQILDRADNFFLTEE